MGSTSAPLISAGMPRGIRCDHMRVVAGALEVRQDLQHGSGHTVHVRKEGLCHDRDSHIPRMQAGDPRRMPETIGGTRSSPDAGALVTGYPDVGSRSPWPRTCGGVSIELLTGPWALAIMSLLVIGDAFFVVVPGEIAVTALGAIAGCHGRSALWAVIVCAGASAAAGDAACYLIGRAVGTERWRWMRMPRVRQALEWARRRLDGGTATVLFTARFIPFARLAINLVAGASRIHPVRYLCLVSVAALGWAAYQASVGAVVAALVPGGPVVAVIVSVVIALGLGAVIDLVSRRLRK